MAVFLPTVVKFAHVLENHEHEVCIGKSVTHLHEVDSDCEFYKFKLSTQYFHTLKPEETTTLSFINKVVKSQYLSISDYQSLQTSLRGPPAFSLI